MASFRLIASLVIIILVHIALTRAQSISTSTPVPPLQWLNLTGLLTGPAPPPLMEASMGYDEQTRTLIIFGGESQGGFVQSSTYLYVAYFEAMLARISLLEIWQPQPGYARLVYSMHCTLCSSQKSNTLIQVHSVSSTQLDHDTLTQKCRNWRGRFCGKQPARSCHHWR
jgi:hypothetical protein